MAQSLEPRESTIKRKPRCLSGGSNHCKSRILHVGTNKRFGAKQLEELIPEIDWNVDPIECRAAPEFLEKSHRRLHISRGIKNSRMRDDSEESDRNRVRKAKCFRTSGKLKEQLATTRVMCHLRAEGMDQHVDIEQDQRSFSIGV